MFARRIIAAATLALLGGGAADAQDYRARPGYGGALPPFEAITIVRSLGLDPIDRPVWRDGRYIVAALDDDGRRMRVIVDAGSGRVLAVRPVATRYEAPEIAEYGPRVYGPYPEPYPFPYRPRYAPMPDDEFDDDAPSARAPANRQGSLTPPSAAPRATAPSKSTATVTTNPTALPAPIEKKKATDAKASTDAVAKHEAEPSKTDAPKTIRKIEIDKKPADQTPPVAPLE